MKTLIKVFVCVVFSATCYLLHATNSSSSQDNIIYEYKTITQKKGQPLASALKTANLTPTQNQLIESIPVMRQAKSTRTFLLSFVVKNKSRLLREVRITRGNRIANFVLKKIDGKLRFVSQPSKITNQFVRVPVKLVSSTSTNQQTKTSASSLLVSQTPLSAIKVIQKKGQSFKDVLSSLGITKDQKHLLLNGKFSKNARSTRSITLFFEHQGNTRILKGVRIIRGDERVNYVTSAPNNKPRLINTNTLNKKDKTSVFSLFSSAKYIKPPTKSAGKVKNKKAQPKIKPIVLSSAKSSTPKKTTFIKTNVTTRSKGNYQLIRFYQKKGKAISSSMKSLSLSSGQKALINQIPVMKKAKSTRQFNLLFEKKGKTRFLKAACVIRESKRADFVLVNYKGKWVWSNKKGEINTTSSAGFLRYPLSFSRISSPFNLRRRHPITRRIRPHKGVDFKAPHGRSIWAPANGIVTFSGRQRGYGITLVIDHQNGYKTKYAHLSRIMKGARQGRRVKKKQIVARVGNTGFSTGAHLHYEVIVRGRNKNPLTVSLPGGGGSKKLSQGIKNSKKYLPKLQQLMR